VSQSSEVLVRMTGIEKYFPGVHALDQVQFELRAGEVHALVGENGAGKSTLMKILTGIYQKDGGQIEVMGKPVEISSINDAQALGISIVHQELNLLKDLTVAENIYIGRENMNGILLDKKAQNERAQAHLDALNIKLDATHNVGRMTVAKQQMVEIAKALSYDNIRILILDEPTAPLSDIEIEDLFTFVRDMRSRGVGIIYISHRMGELKQISDRITVMRDGQYVDTVNTAEVSMDEIIRMMVGRVIYEQPKTHSAVAPDAPVVLQVKNLCSREVKDVSFSLRKGEILGLAGLVGAGRTEVCRLICGADKRNSGEIFVDGELTNIQSPAEAVEAGIGYLSEDRKRFGLCLGLSVANNTALTRLGSFMKGLTINDRDIRTTAQEYKERLDIGGCPPWLPLSERPRAQGQRPPPCAGQSPRHPRYGVFPAGHFSQVPGQFPRGVPGRGDGKGLNGEGRGQLHGNLQHFHMDNLSPIVQRKACRRKPSGTGRTP
jgi:ribose transport system ATP-binding protein